MCTYSSKAIKPKGSKMKLESLEYQIIVDGLDLAVASYQKRLKQNDGDDLTDAEYLAIENMLQQARVLRERFQGLI